jgi:hypothetical protein
MTRNDMPDPGIHDCGLLLCGMDLSNQFIGVQSKNSIPDGRPRHTCLLHAIIAGLLMQVARQPGNEAVQQIFTILGT